MPAVIEPELLFEAITAPAEVGALGLIHASRASLVMELEMAVPAVRELEEVPGKEIA